MMLFVLLEKKVIIRVCDQDFKGLFKKIFRGFCTSYPNKLHKLACFVFYLKIIHIF